ncbi:MAG: S41 family peptidase [Candidatus Krumholzibacteriota bacterium]
MRHRVYPIFVFSLLFFICTTTLAWETEFEEVLRFEGHQKGENLRGWGGGPRATIHVDTTVVHGGDFAVRLERNAQSENSFTTITKTIPLDFTGKWIELRGFLRTEGVTGFAGLWMREDGPGGMVQFDNMQGKNLKGTTEWTEYAIRLKLDSKATDLFFGVLVSGEGSAWADDLELIVDGKPFHQAPKRVIKKTILDTDQEFSVGSGISVSQLTETQIENVALLGQVWGFLKYHHPRVAAGEIHWDFELFRVLPKVLDATDRQTCNSVLGEWVEKIGVPDSCDPCAQAPENAHLSSDLGWIKDAELLGTELSGQLQGIFKNRLAGGEQFYLSTAPRVGNPIFDRELTYYNRELPDSGYRILALLRLWNIIEYWFPYRDQIDTDWEALLPEFIPLFVAADSWDAYRLELFAFTAHIRDSHANLWPEIGLRPPRGKCNWPVEVRFIEGKATVAAFTDSVQGPGSGLEIGDIIENIDDRPINSLVEEWSPYYCASNKATMLKDIARFMSRGECGECTVGIDRRGKKKVIAVDRVTSQRMNWVPHDREGETFQLLSDEVAYMKLSSIRIEDVAGYIEQAAGTRGLVIDIRNYPGEFVVFALGSRLVKEPTAFTRFTRCDPVNPGAFIWSDPLLLQPESPGYGGKVAILVNEVSMSQSEYTAMALRAGPQAVVVGSTTAGADGNVSRIPLPSGLKVMMSGIGVFYPDKTPTQRVGIVPDILATPTIEGVREGRDEVLEAALRHIIGDEADENMIRGMAGGF